MSAKKENLRKLFLYYNLLLMLIFSVESGVQRSTGIFFQVQEQYTKVLLEWYLANKNLWVCNSTALFVEKSIFSGRVLLGKKMFNIICFICTTKRQCVLKKVLPSKKSVAIWKKCCQNTALVEERLYYHIDSPMKYLPFLSRYCLIIFGSNK